jgi:Flp pilus assembly protein TadG
MRIRNRRLRRFVADRSGLAAVEFAMAAPVLLAALVGIADAGSLIADRRAMQAAAHSGAQYFLSGGRDLEEARQVVEQAWSTRPEGSEVVTERYCMCADVVHACNTLCADESIPESYSRIRIRGPIEGIWTETTYDATETVRVR